MDGKCNLCLPYITIVLKVAGRTEGMSRHYEPKMGGVQPYVMNVVFHAADSVDVRYLHIISAEARVTRSSDQMFFNINAIGMKLGSADEKYRCIDFALISSMDDKNWILGIFKMRSVNLYAMIGIHRV